MWKMRTVLINLQFIVLKSPPEHLAVDEIIVLFKGSHLQKLCTKETQTFWDKGLEAE
jgi:hypothetical protein